MKYVMLVHFHVMLSVKSSNMFGMSFDEQIKKIVCKSDKPSRKKCRLYLCKLRRKYIEN